MAYTSKQIEKTKERLNDLRNEKGYILKQLSEELLKSQDISISHGMLGAYGETDREKKSYDSTASMSIDKFVALADFYKVPVDYLLGRIDSKVEENIPISKEIGLTDKSIENLKKIFSSNNDDHGRFSVKRSDILNDIISSPIFVHLIDSIAKAKEFILLAGYYDYLSSIESYDLPDESAKMNHISSSETGVPDMNYYKASKYYKHEAEDDFNYLIEQYFNYQIDPDRFYLFESTEDLLNDERLIKNLEAVAQECNFSSDSESEDEDIFDIEE